MSGFGFPLGWAVLFRLATLLVLALGLPAIAQAQASPGARGPALPTVTGDGDALVENSETWRFSIQTLQCIEHAFVADLDIVLRSPAATPVPAINRTDDDGNNFCQTLLDDNSAAEACPPKPLALVVGPGDREAIGRQLGAALGASPARILQAAIGSCIDFAIGG
jgi:hypothetical protein